MILAMNRLAAALACIAPLAGGPGWAAEPPERADPAITVTTVFPGASAAEVESLVTAPLEQALNGMPGLRSMTSTSRQGLSDIRLELSPDRDDARARQEVAERVLLAEEALPAGSQPPRVSAFARDAWPGIWLALRPMPGAAAEDSQLAAAARRVAQRIERIPNVAKVEVFGAPQPEIQVRCDPRKLVARRIAFEDCLKAIRVQARSRPLSREEVADLMLKTQDDAPLRVRDVAEVRLNAPQPARLAWLDGQPTIALGVFVHSTVAAELQRSIGSTLRKELPEIQRKLPPTVNVSLPVGTNDMSLNRGGSLVELRFPFGTKSPLQRRLATLIEGPLRARAAPGVVSVWRRDDGSVMRMFFRASQAIKKAELLGALRELQPQLPGVVSRVAQLPPGPAAWRPRYDVELFLIGPDRRRLREWSRALVRRFAIGGYLDVVNDADEIPEVSVRPDQQKLAQHGIDQLALAQSIHAYKHGKLLDQRGDSPAIRLLLDGDADPRKLASLLIPAGDGLIALGDLATVQLQPRLDPLQLFNQRPMIRVTAALPSNNEAPSPAGDAPSLDAALRLADDVRRELRLSDEFIVKCRADP